MQKAVLATNADNADSSDRNEPEHGGFIERLNDLEVLKEPVKRSPQVQKIHSIR